MVTAIKTARTTLAEHRIHRFVASLLCMTSVFADSRLTGAHYMAVLVYKQAEALWNECDRATNGFHVTSGELKDRQATCDQRARSACGSC